MNDPNAYGIEVRGRTIDGEAMFEARVRELPDLAEYADTAEEAYALALDAVAITAQVFAEKGKPMPLPMVPVDDWSGRVTLRLPRSLHRALAEVAEAEGCSLNQHIVNVLSYFSGYAHAESAAEVHWQPQPQPQSRHAGPPVATRHLRVVASRDYDKQLAASY